MYIANYYNMKCPRNQMETKGAAWQAAPLIVLASQCFADVQICTYIYYYI